MYISIYATFKKLNIIISHTVCKNILARIKVKIMLINPMLYKILIPSASLFGHIYVLWNIFAPFLGKRNKYEFILAIIGTCMICFIQFKCRMPNYLVFRIMYYGFSLWFGLFLLSFMCSTIFHFMNFINLISGRTKSKLIIIFSIILLIYSIINAGTIRISDTKIELNTLQINKKYKIVQISDLHLGCLYRKPYIMNICEKINEINPNFVVITGDLFDGNLEYEFDLIKPLSDLKMPVYFIMGNHDLLYENEIRSLLNKTNFIYLNDATELIYEDLQLIGFDYSNPRPKIKDKIADLKLMPNRTNILLYHCPAFDVDLLESLSIQLHLAGHTHGGQIFPVHFLQLMNYRYLSGLYASKNKKSFVYTSQGLGTTGTPLRLGTKPTLEVITLLGKHQ